MKIALDPFMHRHLSLEQLPSKVAELGYDWMELSQHYQVAFHGLQFQEKREGRGTAGSFNTYSNITQ